MYPRALRVKDSLVKNAVLLDEQTNVPCNVVALAFYATLKESINLHNSNEGTAALKAWLGILASQVSFSVSDKLIIPAIQLITFYDNFNPFLSHPLVQQFYSQAAISAHLDEALVI